MRRTPECDGRRSAVDQPRDVLDLAVALAERPAPEIEVRARDVFVESPGLGCSEAMVRCEPPPWKSGGIQESRDARGIKEPHTVAIGREGLILRPHPRVALTGCRASPFGSPGTCPESF